MHAIWISIVLPVFLMLIWQFPVLRNSNLWITALAVFGLAIAGVLGIELFEFSHYLGSPSHIVRIVLHRMIMMTDVPLVELSLASVINWWICR